MQFITLPVLALFATVAFAMPSKIESRVDCGDILPACNGGSVVGQTDCRCSGQQERCDLWTCPGPSPNTMVCGQANTGCVWI